MTRIALLYTRLRAEEKLLLDAADDADVHIETVWDEEVTLDAHHAPDWAHDVDLALVRTLSLNRALAIAQALEHHGLPTVNDARTLARCGDKWTTTLALAHHDVPTPRTRLATRKDAALDAADQIGYPLVTKPTQGSWARGLALATDEHALAGVLEQRETYAGPQHQQHYLQEHIDKPDRDIRAFVIGDQVACAIHRETDHWITNTAQGATATNRPLDDELERICLDAADALTPHQPSAGRLLAVDLMETPDGLTVHEVNATMEFRNSIEPTGVNIPHRILHHLAHPPEVPA